MSVPVTYATVPVTYATVPETYATDPVTYAIVPVTYASVPVTYASVPVTYAYHVTNQLYDAQQPLKHQWTHLKMSVVDRDYNGAMADIIPNAVFFSTTLRNQQLPTTTLYPSNGIRGADYCRVSVPLQMFAGYRIIRCHSVFTSQGVTQVALLLVPPNDINLNRRVNIAILQGKVTDLTNTANLYLRRENLQWYSNNYDPPNTEKFWVNFAIPHEVLLGSLDIWDKVRHM